MTSPHTRWHAWLGPAADNITDEQLDRFDLVADTVQARWPSPDEQDARDEALSGALQVIVGDDTLEGLAQAWRAAAQVERARMAALTGALLASSTGARTGSGSEADLIARAGVTRGTVRRALGKGTS